MAKSRKCEELELELAALKERIKDLAAARPQAAAASTEPPSTTEGDGGGDSGGGLPVDFDELMDALKREVEDLNPLTCLSIFALGVLTGRLLAS